LNSDGNRAFEFFVSALPSAIALAKVEQLPGNRNVYYASSSISADRLRNHWSNQFKTHFVAALDALNR